MFFPLPVKPLLGAAWGFSGGSHTNENMMSQEHGVHRDVTLGRDVTGSVGVVSRVLPVHLVLRAVAVLVRMDHAVVLEGDGHWTQTGEEAR